MSNILASGISNREHLAAIDQLLQARFAAIEVEKVLVYIIDTVDADALETLADQFNVLGFKGWKLADTEQKKRDLLKSAIELHRYKGTIYGIKMVLKYLGFPDCRIIEHIGRTYNGVENFDGSVTYSKNNWATFRVIYDLGNDKGISAQQTADLEEVVNEYKNARSHLVDIGWQANLDETVTMSDDAFSINAIFSGVTEPFIKAITYNGAGDYDGEYNHVSYIDIIDVTEISVP